MTADGDLTRRAVAVQLQPPTRWPEAVPCRIKNGGGIAAFSRVCRKRF